MIQRVAPTGSFPLRPAAAALIERALPATGMRLASQAGHIAGDLRRTKRPSGRPFWRKPDRFVYELLVANDTALPIATFAYTLDEKSKRRITWDAIVVPAFTAVAVDLDVQRPPNGHEPRMIAEVYASDAHLILDARELSARESAPRRRPSSRSSILPAAPRFAAGSLAAVAAVGALGFAALRPAVTALSVPADVRVGSPFDLTYAVRGARSATYSVTGPDGRPIAIGTLDERSNRVALGLPATARPGVYDVSVIARGPLGVSARTAAVVAVPDVAAARRPASGPAVHVARVRLQSDTVDGGHPIVVSYESSVPSGSVRLIDQYGNVRGEALLSARGRSTLAAPYVDTDQDLQVVVSANAGGKRSQVAIPVTVRHVDPIAAAVAAALAARLPALAPAGHDAAASRDGSENAVAVAGPPITVERDQRAGRPIVVRISHYVDGLRVALMGSDGDEIASRDISPDDTTATFDAPASAAKGRTFSIVATYNRGLSQETIVRPIAISAP